MCVGVLGNHATVRGKQSLVIVTVQLSLDFEYRLRSQLGDQRRSRLQKAFHDSSCGQMGCSIVGTSWTLARPLTCQFGVRTTNLNGGILCLGEHDSCEHCHKRTWKVERERRLPCAPPGYTHCVLRAAHCTESP
ncbi:hypothetical protein GE21DRAFT_4494 [Neurospora crassa]|uniref:Uncharacterized protein n=1 Tax=Neurospora crassa (strain ATCC 24698 / 74-OR23-1A / CBS 708.71 / DSM 1257 / FGSC 987) TaxID=367110 RepID=Q7RX90_NEUCR|nr:hypothetical protein NCU00197 [Neurospora crassa OR74A]EAA27184.1 hypothetical protein NCU00197 [Neurospora crassa OR74A]KHE89393.1 hypothetical protein GE21DRAFT_4494 [Neurospora crassa]|eukprot:XP_956420.1 hypothetical protein NCU00197 [Neurospora crassa OR74A]